MSYKNVVFLLLALGMNLGLGRLEKYWEKFCIAVLSCSYLVLAIAKPEFNLNFGTLEVVLASCLVQIMTTKATIGQFCCCCIPSLSVGHTILPCHWAGIYFCFCFCSQISIPLMKWKNYKNLQGYYILYIHHFISPNIFHILCIIWTMIPGNSPWEVYCFYNEKQNYIIQRDNSLIVVL